MSHIETHPFFQTFTQSCDSICTPVVPKQATRKNHNNLFHKRLYKQLRMSKHS